MALASEETLRTIAGTRPGAGPTTFTKSVTSTASKVYATATSYVSVTIRAGALAEPVYLGGSGIVAGAGMIFNANDERSFTGAELGDLSTVYVVTAAGLTPCNLYVTAFRGPA